jgi:hypothetical protein
VFPQATQEIARARYADLLREATQERRAALLREETTPAPTPLLRHKANRWLRAITRRAALRTA